MKTTLYFSPVAAGQPLAADRPHAMLSAIRQAFPDRYSAVGLRLDRSDLTRIAQLNCTSGERNREAWEQLLDAIEEYGAVHVWAEWNYEPEVGQ